MVFDPMKFYDDGQRRQKRYDSLVPVFVVAIVLLVVFGAGFFAYQRSHVKPKPVAPAVVHPNPVHDTEFTCPSEPNGSDEGCNTWRNQTTVTQSSTTWYRCSDGVTVTGDLKNCPEYAGSGGTKVLDVGHEPFTKDEFAYSRKTPRKYKRKPHEFIGYTGDPVARNIFIESPPANPATKIEFYNPHVRVTLQQLRQYAQEYPAPICILNIIGECWVTLDPDPKPYCLPGGSVKGDIPPCGEGTWYYRSRTPEISPEGGICDLGECGYSDRPTVPVGAPVQYWTTGGTKPTAPYICREAGECFPKCDSPLAPQISRACYQATFSGQNTLILPSNYALGFTCPNEFESCGVVNSTIYVPHEHLRDCKMPADVDVCPQTLDPKASDDKKGKP